MKKILLSLGFLLCVAMTAQAQGILGRIGQGAKRAAEEATQRQVNKQVEKAVDKAFEGDRQQQEPVQQQDNQQVGWTCPACGNTGNTGKFCGECGAKQPSADGWTCPACGHAGNKGKFCSECGAKQGDNANNAATAKPKNDLEMTYAKSDFVAGDEIIFDDQMDGEKLGEFPSQWDLIDGVAEVASINGKKAICFVGNDSQTNIEPLMKNPKAYLPEIFTIEFDFFIKGGDDKGHYHPILIGDVDDRTNYDLLTINLYNGGRGEYNAVKPDRTDVDGNFDFADVIKVGDWNHFALSFNKRACKVYINGVRYVNVPNMQAPKKFKIGGSWWNGDVPYEYITNIRIAQGAVPLYDRMMTDGKFITYGITFDVNKSVIKPESMGEINRIVQLMNENPSLKFSVEGHTDATGNAANNQKLSEARANAIVDKLVEMGIAKERLTAVGKGQNSPIADNNSDEGRAKNRRVEFVKQ